MKRLRAVLCLVLATAAIVFAARFCNTSEQLAVVVASGQDPMRAVAYVNGIETALAGEERLQLRRFETDDSPDSLYRIAKQLKEQRYLGVLTNSGQAASYLGELTVPVLTMGESENGICMTADWRDEMQALLSYAEQTNIESMVVLLPERAEIPSSLLHWLRQHPNSGTVSYPAHVKDVFGELDRIAAQKVDAIMVWEDASQSAQLISQLRHVGYTGIIFGPSFLADYEALGINAGQAAGLCFAAQYTDPRHNAAILTRSQQQFIRQYTKQFNEAPLFADSYYGADQVRLIQQIWQSSETEQTPLHALAQCGWVQGLVQPYDFFRNPRTGVVEMVVYEIQSGRIEEAR